MDALEDARRRALEAVEDAFRAGVEEGRQEVAAIEARFVEYRKAFPIPYPKMLYGANGSVRLVENIHEHYLLLKGARWWESPQEAASEAKLARVRPRKKTKKR